MSSSPRALSKGANLTVEDAFGDPAAHIAISIETVFQDGHPRVPTDVSAVVVGQDGRVRSNKDLVFYNQPTGANGAVRLLPAAEVGTDGDRAATVTVDLSELPDSVELVVVAASIDPDVPEQITFGSVDAVHMSASTVGGPPALVSSLVGLTDERALIFGEIYRRDTQWKIRAVGQGYRDGLSALVTDYGIEVDHTQEVEPPDTRSPDAAAPDLADAATSTSSGEAEQLPEPKVALGRRRRTVAKLPQDWRERISPGLAFVRSPDTWRSARLFPTVGMKSSAEQEGRTTSTFLAMMEIVPDLGKRIVTLMGGPRGRVETFTEVRFSHAGQDLRPDGLVRVTRGATSWTALVEVKTGKGTLTFDQVDSYIKLARVKNFDAVITISCDLMPCAADLPFVVAARPPKSVTVQHISWEEIVTEAALARAGETPNRTHDRLLEEFIRYGADPHSGMWSFSDMGRHWVKVRSEVSDGTLAPGDQATAAICTRFDQLTRHVALQLTALTGQTVTSQIPGSPADAVSRAKQLADSGELFGSLRVAGATSPIVVNANLARQRISCAQQVAAPRTGRTSTKVNWLLRQLTDAPPRLRITAHHLGSRSDVTSALLETARADPSTLLPPNDKDIREFTVTAEASMGTKRAATDNGFVTTMVELVDSFYAEITQVLRPPRPDR
ncbi:TerD family protein [Tsukamurella sp. 8F]|uniref:TerD family protein n=1 Tax=unclassified Tsukamurella TaxID=2633480 RepID=UPI0023B92C28|nr:MULTISPECIES: TerD family protein [unclassified Tsukamurella]MDF0530458.1 TerD family protein [Tsukamurella sp. 8J]MDF0587721.1 TerD family protein [Tsukamurella sp. 8F]